MDESLRPFRSRVFSGRERHAEASPSTQGRDAEIFKRGAGNSGRWRSWLGRKSNLRLIGSSRGTSSAIDSSDGSSSMSSDVEAVVAAATLSASICQDDDDGEHLPGIREEPEDAPPRHHSGRLSDPFPSGRSSLHSIDSAPKSGGSSPRGDRDQARKEKEVGISEQPILPAASENEIKRNEREGRATAWFEAQIAKIEDRFNRDKSAIMAWENGKRLKAEMRMKQVERKLDEKKAKASRKMQKEIDRIRKKAEERMAIAESVRGVEKARAIDAANKIRSMGKMPSRSRFA